MSAICIAIGVFAASATGLRAESYPSKTIRIISMHPPGSVTDVLARPIAHKLSANLATPVIVENKPGANGIIATGYVAKEPADGYTILITSGALIANAHLGKHLSYDPLKDLAPITEISGSYGLALITKLPVNSVSELVALGKKRQLTFAMSGVGNVTQIAGLLFERMAGIKMVAVPYNRQSLVNDVMAGTVDIAFFAISLSAPLVDAGKVKALALTGPLRSPALPNVPTLQELGYKGFDVTGYFGLLAPAGTPRDRIELLYRETKKTLSSPQVENIIVRGGQYVVGSTPAEFTAFLKKDDAYQARLMTQLGLNGK